MTGHSRHSHKRRALGAAVMPCVYVLAEHLDAALALAEDLQTVAIAVPTLKPGMAMRTIEQKNAELARGVDRVRALELAMTMRLLQARKAAEILKRHDSSLQPVIALFVGGTAQLDDVAATLGDTRSAAFETGNGMLAFLRARCLIPAGASGLDGMTRLTVGDAYAVAGAIPLGALMGMIAQFLDTLELMFELFGGVGGEPLLKPASRLPRPAPDSGVQHLAAAVAATAANARASDTPSA